MSDGNEIKNILEVQVAGKDLSIWKEKKPELIAKIQEVVDKIMDHIADPINQTTVRDEAKEVISLSLDHIKQKLAKPGIENQQTLAEIEQIYARINQTKTEERKTKAEADKLEFDNMLRKLEFSLGSTKILLLNDKDDETVIFTRQLDAWIKLVRDLRAV